MKLPLAFVASVVVSLASLVPLAGCSGDDVSAVPGDAMAESGQGKEGVDGGSIDDDSGSTGSDATTDGAIADAASSSDSALPMIDASGVDANATTNAFTGAAAFTATLGPTSRNAKHTPTDNPAGQACMTCHDGSKKNVVEFLAGGTVYKTPAGTAPAPSVEARVREANGNALSAFSDADGNFFVPRGARGPLVSPARGGARDATTLHLMVNLINNGDCNSCHRPSAQAPLNVQ